MAANTCGGSQVDKEIIRDGYNRIAQAYAAQRDHFKNLPYLQRLLDLLHPGAAILDLGCGSGVPVDAFLVEHGFSVTGLDVAEQQIELARQQVPRATYLVQDMAALEPGAFQVDAVVSFYAIFHMPREAHADLFRTLRSFLPEQGLLLVTMGSDDWEGTDDDFHGVTMAWSHYAPETNRRIIEAAGFEVVLDEIDTSGDERHQVIMARAI